MVVRTCGQRLTTLIPPFLYVSAVEGASRGRLTIKTFVFSLRVLSTDGMQLPSLVFIYSLFFIIMSAATELPSGFCYIIVLHITWVDELLF